MISRIVVMIQLAAAVDGRTVGCRCYLVGWYLLLKGNGGENVLATAGFVHCSVILDCMLNEARWSDGQGDGDRSVISQGEYGRTMHGWLRA